MGTEESAEELQAQLDRLQGERLQVPEPPLTLDERRRVRKMLDEYEKAAWLRKKILTFTPWLIAVVGALGSAWQFLSTRK